jgi:hypothetical protein
MDTVPAFGLSPSIAVSVFRKAILQEVAKLSHLQDGAKR